LLHVMFVQLAPRPTATLAGSATRQVAQAMQQPRAVAAPFVQLEHARQ
jgi:hypothetical protein